MACSRPTTCQAPIVPLVTCKHCAHLPSSKTFVVCISCGEESVCLKCVGSTHTGHVVVDMEDFLDLRKEMLSELVQDGQEKLKSIKARLSRVQNIQDRSNNMVESVIKDIKTRGEILKHDVDMITEEFIRKCRVSEWNNNNKLSVLEEKLQREVDKLDKSITKCNEVLRSTRYDNFLVFESDLRNNMDCTFDSLPVLQILGLDIGKQESPPSQLKGLYGSLKIDDWKFESMTTTTTTTENNAVPLNATETSTDLRNWPLKKIVQGIFQHSDVSKINSVCPVDEFGAWVICAGSNKVDFMLPSGEIKKTVKAKMVPKTKIKVVINDIICTEDTRKTLMCCNDKSIRQVLPNGNCGIMFRADNYVSSLCESQEVACILVCNDSGKLVRYREIGETLQTIEHDSDGRKLMTSPFKVRMNHNNGDIVVIEHAHPRHVIVIDKLLTVISKYYGDEIHISSDRPTTATTTGSMQREFDPRDISFYDETNIAIADYGSRSVVLIDRNGTLLRTLWRDDNRPTCLGISTTLDNEIITWIGFDDGSIKVIKHLPTCLQQQLVPLTKI